MSLQSVWMRRAGDDARSFRTRVVPVLPAEVAAIGPRLLSVLLDQLVVAVVLGAVAWVWVLARGAAGPGLLVVWLVLATVIEVGQVFGEAITGATLGAHATRTRTVSAGTGWPAGLIAVTSRRLLLVASGLVVPVLGTYVVAASGAADATPARRGWHDRLCGTLVLRAWAVPGQEDRERIRAHRREARRAPVAPLQLAPGPLHTARHAAPPVAASVTTGSVGGAAAGVAVAALHEPAGTPPAGVPVTSAPEPVGVAVSAHAGPVASPAVESAVPPGPEPVVSPATPSSTGAPPPVAGYLAARPWLGDRPLRREVPHPRAAHDGSAPSAARGPVVSPWSAPEVVAPGEPGLPEELELTRLAETVVREPVAARLALAFDTGQHVEVVGVGAVGRDLRHLTPPPVHAVVIRDPARSVSRLHLRFGPAGADALWVVDERSTNGTTLVDPAGHADLLTPGERGHVADGWQIRFGDRVATVRRVRPEPVSPGVAVRTGRSLT